MTLVVAQEVPTSSTMALPHGPTGVSQARRKLREELSSYGVPDSVIDDAVLILSELLSNSFRHARPIGRRVPVAGGGEGSVLAGWRIGMDGTLLVEVTDGGGPTRPLPSSPSLTARGGRGLGIVRALSMRWGVRDTPGEVTVWAALPSGTAPDRGPALGARGVRDPRDRGQGDLGALDRARRLDVSVDVADPFDDL